MMSSVDNIINALTELESDIDKISLKVEEMKKIILIHSDEEITKLREKVMNIANLESEKILSTAKQEAEKESLKIQNDAEKNLLRIKKNIETTFDTSVQLVVDSILNKKT